jgi:hypothetical protein
MPLYLLSPSPASAQVTVGVPCRCCPGGISRSVRGRLYPSDMSDAEWAVIEPLLPAPGWTLGRGGSPGRYCRQDTRQRDSLPDAQRAGMAGDAR